MRVTLGFGNAEGSAKGREKVRVRVTVTLELGFGNCGLRFGLGLGSGSSSGLRLMSGSRLNPGLLLLFKTSFTEVSVSGLGVMLLERCRVIGWE